MKLPYAGPLIPVPPSPLVIPEPPRPGEPGGPPCGICAQDEGIWSDANWVLHTPTGGSLPGTVWLASRAHHDSFRDLPDALAADFGRVVARIETAVLSLGGVGRVHLYRWGDGMGHFHVWFLPRPLGMLDAVRHALPLWEDVMEPVPRSEIDDAGARLAKALA